jgi:hypothetical protein
MGLDDLLLGVHEPALPDARQAVFVQFFDKVILGGGGGEDFYHQIRRAVTAPVVQFGGVADNGNIGFKKSIVAVVLLGNNRTPKGAGYTSQGFPFKKLCNWAANSIRIF